MYKILCKAFDIPPRTNIWRGKAVVVAFQSKASFAGFERVFFKNTVNNEQGLAHSRANGDVIISCYYGKDPSYFSYVLVHEAVHGFMHRFQSRRRVPSWLNEGAAEWIAGKVVDGCDEVPFRQQKAKERLLRSRCLDDDFFTATNIEGWQYGVASSLTDYLLERNPRAYRKLIEHIKVGVDWEESLRQAYGVTPEELIAKYGEGRLRVRDLKLPDEWRTAGKIPAAEIAAGASSGTARQDNSAREGRP